MYNLEHDYIINTLQALRDCKEPIKLNQEKFAKQINIVANLSNIMQYLNVNTLETNETIYVQKVDKNNILKLKANIIEVKENKLSKLKYTVSISLKLIYNENLEIYSSNIQFEQLIKYYYQQLAKISTLKYPQENFYFELENQNSSFKIILSEKINQSSFVSLFDNFIFKVVGYCYLKFNINLEKKIENIFLNELIKHTKILYSNELYSIKDVINMINSKDHKIQNKGLDLSYCIIKLFFHRKIPNDFMEFALQDTPTINDIHKLELLSSSNYP